MAVDSKRIDSMTTLDGFLTMKAQDVFGAEAQVLKMTDGNWLAFVLRRPGRDDLRLGAKFFEARSALQALIRGERMKQREGTGR